MSPEPIDPTPYLRPPRFRADIGLSLAKRLLQAVPPHPTAGVSLASNALAERVAELEEIWKDRGKVDPPRNARAADLRLDRAWATVHDRIASWTIFDPDDPDRTSAEALLARLFHDGLVFLKLPFMAQHAQSERRLQIIEAEGLRPDLEHLVGEVFIEELEQAHAEYGDALGITQPVPASPDTQSMVGPLRELSRAIVHYTVQILAYSGLSPDNLAPARRALQPIDDVRQAASRRGREPARVEEPSEVAPDLDAPILVVASA